VANSPNHIMYVIQSLQEDPNPLIDYTWQDNILRYKENFVLSLNSSLKPRILNEFHSSAIMGHLGFQKTHAHASHSFFQEGMKKTILTFVTECDIFQCNKGESVNT
jgi:hypothetical protein